MDIKSQFFIIFTVCLWGQKIFSKFLKKCILKNWKEFGRHYFCIFAGAATSLKKNQILNYKISHNDGSNFQSQGRDDRYTINK